MFTNRWEAGSQLAEHLTAYRQKKNALVLAIPRGGVVVGRALADSLDLPLDVVVVKKLGAPNNPELAIGAISAGGVVILDKELIANLGVSEGYLQEEIQAKTAEVKARLAKFRLATKGLSRVKIAKKIVILTDDGIATGATTEAAIEFVKRHHPEKVILAVPVAPRDTIQKLATEVSEVIVLEQPEIFNAVGQFYESFPQVSDEEMRELLASRR